MVWAGTNLGSYSDGAAAIKELMGVTVSAKQMHRVTSRIGQDRCGERALCVEAFRAKPLATRTAANPTAEVPALGVVMMDGGRHGRRDHFGQPRDGERVTHWKENKVGLALSMESQVHQEDPAPEFPEWLAGAKVVCEIAHLAEQDEQTGDNPALEGTAASPASEDDPVENHDERTWAEAPKVLGREVIASTQEADSFGWHLAYKAWQQGVSAAPRQAFVADGASANWTIHRKHFSQMTGVLDLMHALSYAYRAAAAVDDASAYRRFAEWIWQGHVGQVIRELKMHQKRLGLPEKNAGGSDPRQRVHRALTYFTNHQHRMNYPQYRKHGLPLTSSHIESAIKQINRRVKGTEKFWKRDHAEALLQLRADSLSDAQPLKAFWTRWRTNLTGANTYRTTVL